MKQRAAITSSASRSFPIERACDGEVKADDEQAQVRLGAISRQCTVPCRPTPLVLSAAAVGCLVKTHEPSPSHTPPTNTTALLRLHLTSASTSSSPRHVGILIPYTLPIPIVHPTPQTCARSYVSPPAGPAPLKQYACPALACFALKTTMLTSFSPTGSPPDRPVCTSRHPHLMEEKRRTCN